MINSESNTIKNFPLREYLVVCKEEKKKEEKVFIGNRSQRSHFPLFRSASHIHGDHFVIKKKSSRSAVLYLEISGTRMKRSFYTQSLHFFSTTLNGLILLLRPCDPVTYKWPADVKVFRLPISAFRSSGDAMDRLDTSWVWRKIIPNRRDTVVFIFFSFHLLISFFFPCYIFFPNFHHALNYNVQAIRVNQ